VLREDGFTLTEILVVILVVGILAGIAIPTLLSQRQKATDVVAKSAVATANRAMIIYDEDHDSYACGDSSQCRAAMSAIDPVLGDSNVLFTQSGGSIGDPTANGYRVTAPGGQARTFWVDRAPGAHSTDRGCDLNGSADNGGCRVAPPATGGTW